MTAFHANLNMREHLKKFAVSKSVKSCGTRIKDKTEFAALNFGETTTAVALGRSTCKSPNCPTCRTRYMLKRRSELQHIIDEKRKQFKYVSLLTLTAPHYSRTGAKKFFGQSKMRTGITGAATLWKQGHFFKTMIESYVSVFECTYGKNGIHAHYHIILFSDEPIEPYYQRVLEDWRTACKKSGLGRPSDEHGIKITHSAKDLAEYLAKWSVHDEVSGQFVKSAKNGNFTLPELEVMSVNNIGWAKRMLKTFYSLMYRRKTITYSRNLSEIREQYKKEKIWSRVPIFFAKATSELDDRMICSLLNETDFSNDVIDLASSMFDCSLPAVDMSSTPESREYESEFLDELSNRFANTRALLTPIDRARGDSLGNYRKNAHGPMTQEQFQLIIGEKK